MTDASLPMDPDPISFEIPALRASQPIGDLYLANFPHRTLSRIAFFDVRRRIQELRDIERYLGIQRPLNAGRVADLHKYVNFVDATFPTSIIISIPDEYASFDEGRSRLIIRNYREGEDQEPSIPMRMLARVIDGQHRIAGLMGFEGDRFDVPVTVFVGSDIADQAYVFSTVNLEQTKVSKSLAYDLFELARSRSPQKTCHNIAIAMDRDPTGPMYERVKRLGLATDGRTFEPVTQATFVESIVKYISDDPRVDRDKIIRKEPLTRAEANEDRRLIFRNLFIDGKDIDIIKNVSGYLEAVRDRWPNSWGFRGTGQMLNRTNGFRALMRAMRYFYLRRGAPGDVVSREDFLAELNAVGIDDGQFSTEAFPPGSAGEARLYRTLVGEQ